MSYCINLLHKLSLISCTHEIQKFNSWRPNGKKKTQIWDSETQHFSNSNLILQDAKNHLKTRLLRPIKNASKISSLGQNFLRPTFFKVYTPQIQSAAYIRNSLSVYLHHQMTDTGIFVMFVTNFISYLENCRAVIFVHHIVSQSFFFTLKRNNKGYSIHHLTLIWVWINLYYINFVFTRYAGPQLKVVSTMSVGFDHVSLPEAVKR